MQSTLNFRCLKASKRGAATLSLQFSSDLGQSDPWSSHTVVIPEASGVDPFSGVIFTITADGDYNNVQATLPASAADGQGRIFARLSAMSAP